MHTWKHTKTTSCVMTHIKTSLIALGTGTSLPADVTHLIKKILHQTSDQMSHINAKVVPVQATKAYRRRGTATHKFNLGTRWKWWKPNIRSPFWVFMICHVKALLHRGEWSISCPLLYPQKITPHTYWPEGREGPRNVLDILEKETIFFTCQTFYPIT